MISFSRLRSPSGCGRPFCSQTSQRRGGRAWEAQADALRRAKTETVARKVVGAGREDRVAASTLRKGDVVVVEMNEAISSSPFA